MIAAHPLGPREPGAEDDDDDQGGGDNAEHDQFDRPPDARRQSARYQVDADDLAFAPCHVGAQKSRPCQTEHGQIDVPGHRELEKAQDGGKEDEENQKSESDAAGYFLNAAEPSVDLAHTDSKRVKHGAQGEGRSRKIPSPSPLSLLGDLHAQLLEELLLESGRELKVVVGIKGRYGILEFLEIDLVEDNAVLFHLIVVGGLILLGDGSVLQSLVADRLEEELLRLLGHGVEEPGGTDEGSLEHVVFGHGDVLGHVPESGARGGRHLDLGTIQGFLLYRRKDLAKGYGDIGEAKVLGQGVADVVTESSDPQARKVLDRLYRLGGIEVPKAVVHIGHEDDALGFELFRPLLEKLGIRKVLENRRVREDVGSHEDVEVGNGELAGQSAGIRRHHQRNPQLGLGYQGVGVARESSGH